jgi:voltage-gated potassium channel
VLEDAGTTPAIRTAAHAANWIVWLAFCAEYVSKLIVAPHRGVFVRRAWFDLLIIVIAPPFLVPDAVQGLRAVRVVRLLRFVRAVGVAAIGLREAAQGLTHRKFHYVLLTTIVILGVGAVGIFAVEHGENRSIQSLGDALWWAVVTTTTVGYGDVSPVTAEGRLIAVALMVVGIGFIGVLTATITSLFMEQSQPAIDEELRQRLERIEAKLDALSRR